MPYRQHLAYFAPRLAVLSAAALLALGVGAAQAQTIKPGYAVKKPKMITIPGDLSLDGNGAQTPYLGGSGAYVLGFEAVSQYDARAFGRNFVPPDTMGAVGKTQFMAVSNGVYAVYDKSTGAQLDIKSDVNWWSGAGQTGANGDSRILYNAAANRWVVVSFGNSTSDIQIAVSDTSNALGGWKSTKFTGFAGGTADYPTLSMDATSVVIGTNNFKVGCNPGNPTANGFCGTTLNVIPLNSLFSAGAPTTLGMKQFDTPYRYTNSLADQDAGFAAQGVNSSTLSGRIIANSLFNPDNISMRVSGLSADNALGSTLSTPTYLGVAQLKDAGPARQPSTTVAANGRVVDALDQRISSTVHEANGRIYMVQTVDSLLDAQDEARVRYTVIDANTNAILDQGDIGSAGFDYFQGSIAVNASGQVVIAYNRSGSQTADLDGDGLADGNITFMARTFSTAANGHLMPIGNELKLKVSLTDDYHNGSLFGEEALGRQRWGDYSQVTVDPDSPSRFYAIGEFAREYNLPQFGHPGGTGGSRWSTWVAAIDVNAAAVPEPATWGMLLAGIMGMAAWRRRRPD